MEFRARVSYLKTLGDDLPVQALELLNRYGAVDFVDALGAARVTQIFVKYLHENDAHGLGFWESVGRTLNEKQAYRDAQIS